MTLAETAAALAVGGSVVATVLAAATAQISLLAGLDSIQSAMLTDRQIEHLLDAALDSAAPTTGHRAIISVSADRLTIRADRDHDGTIDPRSAESTAFRLRERSGETALLHTIGLQSMTVRRGLDGRSSFTAYDVFGAPAPSPEGIATVVLVLTTADGPSLELVRAAPP